MALKHVNRRGDTYYLQARTTKTGKPKYYFGRQLRGAPVEDLSEGYEIHERMNDDQVFLRRARPTPLRKADRDMLAAAIRKHAGRLRFLIGIDHAKTYLPHLGRESFFELEGLASDF
jgi:hypothetical protein